MTKELFLAPGQWKMVSDFKVENTGDSIARVEVTITEKDDMAAQIIPTVHMNGTSKTELIAQWRAIILACQNLETVLCQAMPHGRDYYPQGEGATEAARSRHTVRIGIVASVRKDAEAIAMSIMEQGG